MKKLKLNLAHEAGEILTKEEMRGVLGGAGSGSTSNQFFRCYCDPPAIGAWEGYYTDHDHAMESTVKWCSSRLGKCYGGS